MCSQKVVFLIICFKNLTDASIGYFFLTDAFASIASAWIRPCPGICVLRVLCSNCELLTKPIRCSTGMAFRSVRRGQLLKGMLAS